MNSEMENLPARPTDPRSYAFRDLLGMLIRRRWVILAIALPIIAVAAIGTLRASGAVTANARIMIEAKQPSTPEFNNMAPNWDVLMSTAAQVGMSIPVAELASGILEDTLKTLGDEDPTFPKFTSRGQIKRALLDGVNCSQVGESNILSIGFTHKSPRMCLVAVRGLTKAFMEFSIQRQQNPSAVAYYDDQIAMTQAELDSLLALRAQAYEAGGFVAFQANMNFGVSQIRNLQSAMFNERSKRQALAARLASFRKALEENPDHLPTAAHGENAYIMDLKRFYEEEYKKLVDLQAVYREDSEWVRRQQVVVDQIRGKIDAEVRNYIQNLEVMLNEARQAEESYRVAIAEQKAEMARYPAIARQIDSIDMQIETRQDLLETLQMKRGEVRLKADADQRISDLVPLEEPAIRSRVTESRKLFFLMLAVVFAVALGVIAGLFLDNQDHRIFDRLQAERVLELPVLGAISRDEMNPTSHASLPRD